MNRYTDKEFIERREGCLTMANVCKFAPGYYRIIPVKNGWWVFYNKEAADKFEREHFDEIV